MNESVSVSIQDRMRALKEKSNTSSRSDNNTPTQLATLLLLFTKAERECYIHYMEGAKALVDWLRPIAIPDIGDYKIPMVLHSYTNGQLARLIAPEQYGESLDDYLFRLGKVEDAITYTVIHNTIQEINK